MSAIFPKSTACSRPKMSCHRGRTWDTFTVIDAAGNKLDGHLDTTWGHYFYFRTSADTWRKARVLDYLTGRELVADFRQTGATS